MTPKGEIFDRIKRFQEALNSLECEAAIIVQKADLYYLSGCDQDAHLFVPCDGRPILMVRRSLERAKMDSPLEDIVPAKGFSELPFIIQDHMGRLPNSLGLEMDVLPTRFYLSYMKIFPKARFLDISNAIRSLRMKKSEYEISLIERAAALGDEMFQHVVVALKREDTRTELDLASSLEFFYRRRGHAGILRTRGFNLECFYGHVLSGSAGATPSNAPGPTAGTGIGPYFSQGAGKNPILEGDPIMVDYTSNFEGYVSDQGRVFVRGKLPRAMADAHRVMVEVQDMVLEMARPGAVAKDIFETAIDYVKRAGLLQGFLGHPEPVPFIAHGVGLELDELPIIGKGMDTVLEQGMVFALEPKLILPGYGVVGVEDTCVVEKSGARRLNRFPRDIVEVH